MAIKGTEKSETLDGTVGADTIFGENGNDTLNGDAGNDVIFGDVADPLEILTGVPADPNINDPATFDSTGFDTVNASVLGSGNWDFDNVVSGGDDFRTQIIDDVAVEGQAFEFRFAGGGGGDAVGQEAWLDLSTYEENFSLEIKNEDVDAEDGDPFDVDGAQQDVLYLTNVLSISNDPTGGPNSTGEVTVTYEGSDGGTYTVNIEYNGARIEAYGPGGLPIPATFDDVIDTGTGDDIVDGGLGNDTITLGSENDTVIASRGEDSIDGQDGTDVYDAAGDVVVGLNTFSTNDPNINDPLTFDDTGFNSVNTNVLGTGTTWDFENVPGIGAGDDFRTEIVDASNISGSIQTLRYPGGGGGDGVGQEAWMDLSTFEESFTLQITSEDGGSGDGDPFDDDGAVQDVLYLTNVVSLSNDPTGGSSGTGLLTVTYEGSDGGTYTIDLEYDGTRIEAYGTDGSQITDGDIIQSMDVTVGTTGVGNSNIANYGDGTVDKTYVNSDTGTNTGTDTFASIESFVANEITGQSDNIELTGPVATTDVTGIGDDAEGFVVYKPGTLDETTVFFGGPAQPKLSELLNGTAPEAQPGVFGDWTITQNDADESGVIGGISYSNFETVEFETICFGRGTLIETSEGPMPVEDLTVGTMVRTLDHGWQPVRWAHSTRVAGTGCNAPIRISKGALGNDRDLIVSPQHRMFLSGWQLELLFAEDEILVPAKMLINDTTIRQIEMPEVDYYHILFDRHEIVFAEGAPSESFHPGRMGIGTFCEETRAELFRLFPEMRSDVEAFGPSARATLKTHEARLLTEQNSLLDMVAQGQ